MKPITLTQFEYNGEQQLGINFKYRDDIWHHIKALRGVQWSNSLQKFYLPLTSENKKDVFRHLFSANWYVDYSALQKSPTAPLNKENKAELKVKPNHTKPKRIITDDNKSLIRQYVRYLRGLRLSESTVRTYFTFIADFFHHVGKKSACDLNNTDVRLFVEKTVLKKKYAISTHRQLISAIKKFSEFYPQCNISGVELKRPKKSVKLPEVLSQQEVLELLRATRNLKHRAVLALIYAAGLRIGEVLHLELHHIDIDRRQVVIKNAKGRKDRNVILAESFLPLFSNYFGTYTPKRYFVEGAGENQYSAASVRAFLKQACRRAGIKKRVTPHTLRHSFATHLMENGVGLRHIQELLGHAKPETTMLYTHIAKKDLLSIQSPLDLAVSKFIDNDKKHENFMLSGNFKG